MPHYFLSDETTWLLNHPPEMPAGTSKQHVHVSLGLTVHTKRTQWMPSNRGPQTRKAQKPQFATKAAAIRVKTGARLRGIMALN